MLPISLGIRDATMSSSCSPRFCIPLNGFEHPRVNKTTAQHPAERLPDFVLGCLRTPIKKRFRRQNHTAQTEAALCRLLFDESLLNWMRFFWCAQALERHNLILMNSADRRDAGTNCLAVLQNSACTALPKTTTEFRSPQM
jgi:hypothetical protein